MSIPFGRHGPQHDAAEDRPGFLLLRRGFDAEDAAFPRAQLPGLATGLDADPARHDGHRQRGGSFLLLPQIDGKLRAQDGDPAGRGVDPEGIRRLGDLEAPGPLIQLDDLSGVADAAAEDGRAGGSQFRLGPVAHPEQRRSRAGDVDPGPFRLHDSRHHLEGAAGAAGLPNDQAEDEQ